MSQFVRHILHKILKAWIVVRSGRFFDQGAEGSYYNLYRISYTVKLEIGDKVRHQHL